MWIARARSLLIVVEDRSPCTASRPSVIACRAGALDAFGGEPIILGGYHLAVEGMEPRIEPTVHDLANRVRPRVVAPGHLYRLACQGGAREYVCAGKLWAERRRLALRSARDVSGTTSREPPPDCMHSAAPRQP